MHLLLGPPPKPAKTEVKELSAKGKTHKDESRVRGQADSRTRIQGAQESRGWGRGTGTPGTYETRGRQTALT